jgi:hypothetical protein
MSRHLPARPNLEHLKKEAKQLLAELQQRDPAAQLADALHTVARDYGFASWPKLKLHVESIAGSEIARAHPLTGRWVADLARSTQHPANDARQVTLQFAVAGNMVSIVDVTVDVAGRELRGENTLVVDETEYVSERGNGYSVVARWVGASGVEALTKKNEVDIARVSYVASGADTLTLSASARAHDGYPAAEQSVVFHRERAGVAASA